MTIVVQCRTEGCLNTVAPSPIKRDLCPSCIAKQATTAKEKAK